MASFRVMSTASTDGVVCKKGRRQPSEHEVCEVHLQLVLFVVFLEMLWDEVVSIQKRAISGWARGK